jgi:hypothetical protein
MAARMNMLKLLQEVEGFAAFPGRRPQPRPTPAMLLQLRNPYYRNPAAEPKRSVIRIRMDEPEDIETPVAIRRIG